MWRSLVKETVNDYGEVIYQPTEAGFILLIAVCLLGLLLALQVSAKKRSGKNVTKQLVISAMAMALATVTSMIKLIPLPLGGSATLCSMLFITLVGYFYGPYAGLLTGLSHGMLQLILDPKIYSLPQMLVDYPLAFAALGLSGFFMKKKNGLVTGYLVGIFGRFVFCFLSGWLFFAYYAPEGWNGAVYSAAYNLAYIGAEGLITVLILMLPPVRKAIGMVREDIVSGR